MITGYSNNTDILPIIGVVALLITVAVGVKLIVLTCIKNDGYDKLLEEGDYTRLNKRRVNYDVGVAYDSDIELVKKVLLDVVKDDELVLKKEECIVYVYELGSYSIGVRIRCWTKFKDYWPFYNALSEKVLLAFRENGIRIPSSTDIQVDKRN